MKNIPKTAIVLSFLGLIPFFIFSIFQMISLSSITSQSYLLINAELDKLLLSYGLIILSFMAGTHWGFAAKSSGVLSTKAYLSSVIPTFLVFLIIPEHFFSVSHNIKLSLALLLLGFLGILLFDVHHWKEKLAPQWWLSLRVPLTLIVVLLLLVGISA